MACNCALRDTIFTYSDLLEEASCAINALESSTWLGWPTDYYEAEGGIVSLKICKQLLDQSAMLVA